MKKLKILCGACGRPLPKPRSRLEAFERRAVKHPSGCWDWIGSLQANGYACVSFGWKKMLAHRFSYTVFVGPIPDGMCVLHKCDNRRCTNPKHLFLGTLDDNNKDMWTKGRGKTWKTPPGERCPTSKLTDLQVERIREALARGDTKISIAKKFGVSKSCIKSIHSGRTWGHL